MRGILHDAQPSSENICELLNHWLTRQDAVHTIAVYAALPGEVNLSSFIGKNPQIRWAFPRVSGVDLVFHHVLTPLSDLELGNFHIHEPYPSLLEISIPLIDAFICPGLAFDSNGGRLGRGKGYYDRALKHARAAAQKIGVCFPTQRVVDTFSEPHDVLMDRIISG